MLFLGKRHFILAVEQIPRDRARFSATIAEARQQRRGSRLLNWTSCNLFAWWLIIVFIWWPAHIGPLHSAPVPVHQPAHVYVVKGVEQQ
jgi:hypothetical protein